MVDGNDLSVDLLGTYYDAGESSVGWHLLPAGSAFCVERVRTGQSCLKITRLGRADSAPVDYGPLVVDGVILRLLLIHDEDGACLHEVHEIRFEVLAEGLRLSADGCLAGVPRDDLIRGEPH